MLTDNFPPGVSVNYCGVFRNPLNNLGVIPGKLAIPPEADQPQAEVISCQ